MPAGAPDQPGTLESHKDSRVVLVAGLYFIIVCAVGVLRPISNSLALDGLGALDFYKVYIVSAGVLLFVPPCLALAERYDWTVLIPATALFFASHLVVFRILYQPGSAVFGIVFYGWYDLFAAALVSQFFIAMQLLFDAREARRVYPIVLAAGAVGATAGGAITGFLAHSVGTPNLLLVAAALVAMFAVGLPLVRFGATRVAAPAWQARRLRAPLGEDLLKIWRDPHLRFIAATVLLGVLVKQLIDYEFNTLSKHAFQTRDAVSAFQGKFNAATQWLPLLAIIAFRPLMKQRGVRTVVLAMPMFMLAASLGLVFAWGLASAAIAKALDTTFRHSAERTAREILYVPVPQKLKLKAKTYIDVGIETGVGKALSALLLFVLLAFLPPRQIGYAAVALSVVWIFATISLRREYLQSLARSIAGRFASFDGTFADTSDPSTFPAIDQALAGGDALQATFALDLIEQSADSAVVPFAPALNSLLQHSSPQIRTRALAALARAPESADTERVNVLLSDESIDVRAQAVGVLHALQGDSVLRSLIVSNLSLVRTAALAHMSAHESAGADRAWVVDFVERRTRTGADDQERTEAALAAGLLHDPERARNFLTPLLVDANHDVACAAIRSAGRLHLTEFVPVVIDALAHAPLRTAARDALIAFGESVVPALTDRLLDTSASLAVRRNIPALIARIPAQSTADALVNALAATETDRLLDYRILKGLNKLRINHPSLAFNRNALLEFVDAELEAQRSCAAASKAMHSPDLNGAASLLLRRALRESWLEGREMVFRCLALILPPAATYRCYLSLAGSQPASRSNALEWLEQTVSQTVGRQMFLQLAPILDDVDAAPPRLPAADMRDLLKPLCNNGDWWVVQCAAEMLNDLNGGKAAREHHEGMNLIEKVFLIQQIDLLQGARTSQLALLASIAEEIDVGAGAVLIREGDATDALYVVVEGEVELSSLGETLLAAGSGQAFGTWALIDEVASVATARAVRSTRLLRIARADFHELLADHHELALGLLQGLARRIRTLVSA